MKNVPYRRDKPVTSVSALVNDLGWESLQSRRLHDRLSMLYRITNGLVEVTEEYHPMPRCQPTSRGHSRQFQRFQPEVDAFKYSFLPRTVPAWNALPHEVVMANSLDQFKRLLSQPNQL